MSGALQVAELNFIRGNWRTNIQRELDLVILYQHTSIMHY